MVTVKVSSGSTTVSDNTCTVTCCCVTPGENESGPSTGVKSVNPPAVPSAVVYWPVIVLPLAALRLTVKAIMLGAMFPSKRTTSLIEIVGGGSSSTIVTGIELGVPSKPEPVTFDKFTENISSFSSMVSFRMGTVKVLLVSPSAKFKVPLVDVKSLAALALLLLVKYETPVAPALPPVLVTVTVTEPPLSATLKEGLPNCRV